MNEYENITLSCVASSNTNVTITWFLEDKQISETYNRISITTNGFVSNITIAYAKASDVGLYTCNATSAETGLSDVSTPGEVTVNCKFNLLVVFNDRLYKLVTYRIYHQIMFVAFYCNIIGVCVCVCVLLHGIKYVLV